MNIDHGNDNSFTVLLVRIIITGHLLFNSIFIDFIKWIWGPIFPNGEELLKEILTRIKSHQFHAICLTVWICKSNPFTVKKKCFTISIFLISKILERRICLHLSVTPFLILQQVPQPVPQPTNTAKQVKNHLGRKSQGIQKRQPIKRFHMKKSFVAQNSPLFHWKNSRQIQIKACDNEIYVELWLKEPGSRTREMKLIMIRLNL
ncbi:unnamed protein product [Rhizophagus irregularis]|uniref:Uncharacterized protein n=2 Tax=Rhizophagus irregularis TaxID=588596 RepID=A0A915ZML3_9GLOM|nr:unnamed protein product [Rhizophagus irregularis]